MAQCKGTTRKGTDCRLNAMKGSDYCAIHLAQDPAAPSVRETIEDLESRLSQTAKTALGCAIVGGSIVRGLINRSCLPWLLGPGPTSSSWVKEESPLP